MQTNHFNMRAVGTFRTCARGLLAEALGLVLIVGLAMQFFSSSAVAETVSFEFGGIVTDNSLGSIFDDKNIGDSFSGRFIVDTEATRNDVGDGRVNFIGGGLALTINGKSLITKSLGVWDSCPCPDGVIILWRDDSGNEGSLSLRSNQNIYDTNVVPTSLNIADFDVLAIVNLDDLFHHDRDRGTITSLVAAPSIIVAAPSIIAAINDLITTVVELDHQVGISVSLDEKLNIAHVIADDINENNDIAALNSIEAFINSVEAQRGEKITDGEADALILAAQDIMVLLTTGP